MTNTISPDEKALLDFVLRQVELATAAQQTVAQFLVQKYRLTTEDHIDSRDGTITRRVALAEKDTTPW